MEERWRALLILAGARTSMGFQFQAPASVSPGLMADLGLGYGELGTLIGLYFLPGVLIALPGGALGRRFGDARVVAAGLGLMALGGGLTAMAPDAAVLAAGRLVSGIGAVLLNVLMAKMVTDWFAGQRDLTLAMAVFVNSFPVGVGLAMLTLAPLAALAGWAAGLAASAGFALAALVLLRVLYHRHPNDGAGAAPGPGGLWRLSAREALLVSLAGIMWGIFNGAFGVMFGFAPTLLSRAEVAPALAGLLVAAATWLVVVSAHGGGVLAQRGGRDGRLMLAGTIGWACCLVLLAAAPGLEAVALLAAGLLMGLPIGVVMSLPARVLRPENRAIGMGLFYVWLYVGHGGVPPLAGWLGDLTGSLAAPLLLAAALVAAMLPLFLLFRRIVPRASVR
ncbi:MFS transporter [Falsiroseomonas sp.]|uniref:MFS transporter n=1 Tax=Falsiroseomonas sp. TaxID=2870721 RepID=UPI0035620742